MRNGKARFNLNDENAIGPRACLTIMHISESEVVTTKGLCKAFGLAQENVSTVLRALERRGFIRDAGKVDAEGRGRKPKLYMLTGYGRTLAKRLAKVQGLGNNYAMMRGHR